VQISETGSDILEKVAQQAGPEAALALSKAFGLDTEQGSDEPLLSGTHDGGTSVQ